MLAAIAGINPSLIAQSPANPDVVIAGLDHPMGVAVQPQTSQVVVAEGGAARVVRIVGQHIEPIVIGFPLRARSTDAGIGAVGPRGLIFLDRSTIAILGTGEEDRGDPLVIVKVPASSDPPKTIEDALQLTVADANGDRRWQLQGVAVVGSAMMCAMTSPDGRSGVARFLIQNPAALGVATSYGPCELFATTESGRKERFVCLTSSPRGEMVLGHQVQAEQRESRITFYRATDGYPLLQLATGVPSLTALAYGPRQPGGAASHLYALDSSRAADGGGLYRLDAAFAEGQVGIQAQKLASLDRPTAMAWGADGALFVTLLGEEAAETAQPAGKLVRFPPSL